MTHTYSSELSCLTESDTFSIDAVLELRKKVCASKELRGELERLVNEYAGTLKKSPDDKALSLRRAVGLWLLGDNDEAIVAFEKAHPRKSDCFFQGRCYMETNRLDQAEKIFSSLVESDNQNPHFASSLCELLIRRGRYQEASQLARKFISSFSDRPEGYYHAALCHEANNEYLAAMELYNKAIEIDPNHVHSIFRLAYIHELRGDDATALQLYERCRQIPPIYENVLLNLGLLYESLGEYHKAKECFTRVLDADPLNTRARLFLSDVEASLNMYFDEELFKHQERLDQLLSTPITDFELSARCRNCLEKMNIKTLGDLTCKTEAELLSVENFGKTSIEELRKLLHERGLSFRQEHKPAANQLFKDDRDIKSLSIEDIKAQPIASLNLSPRIRKCFANAKLTTLGDILEKTEQELLALDNFGQISLQEVKEKLHSMGLKLKHESESNGDAGSNG